MLEILCAFIAAVAAIICAAMAAQSSKREKREQAEQERIDRRAEQRAKEGRLQLSMSFDRRRCYGPQARSLQW